MDGDRFDLGNLEGRAAGPARDDSELEIELLVHGQGPPAAGRPVVDLLESDLELVLSGFELLDDGGLRAEVVPYDVEFRLVSQIVFIGHLAGGRPTEDQFLGLEIVLQKDDLICGGRDDHRLGHGQYIVFDRVPSAGSGRKDGHGKGQGLD